MTGVGRTKLSSFCDKLIEAGWLAAIIIIPLYFNIYTQRVFAIGKACLLRSIVLLMVLAWVVSVAENWKRDGGQGEDVGLARQVLDFLKLPVVLPVVAFAIVYLVTSITSVWSLVSFRGSYRRFQGTYTTLAYLVIFLLIVGTLRTRRQVERLVSVAVLTSLPVSLYAFIQHYGLDPIPWSDDVAVRVTSTLGNAISISAYLILIVPLTIRQTFVAFSEIRAEEGRPLRILSAVLYLLILVMQVAAIVFSQSRGPFLGLASGLFFFFLLWAVVNANKKLVLSVIGLAVLLGLFLVILNLPNTPLSAVRDWPYVGRLSTIAEATTFESRVLMWRGAINMIQADPLRAVVGYGPETIFVAYQPYMVPELTDFSMPQRNPDRSHNDLLDAVITTGGIGAAVYLLLFGSVFYYGLRGLGLLPESRWQKLFIILLAAGGLVGAGLIWYLAGSLKFIGVSVPGGMLVGLLAYLVVYLVLHRGKDAGWDGSLLLLIGLFSAVVGHFIEIQSGIPVMPTRLMFWTHAALLVVIGLSLERVRPLIPLEVRSVSDGRRRPRDRRRKYRRGERGLSFVELFPGHLLTQSLAVGLIMVALGLSLINLEFNALLLWFMVMVWLFAGAVVIIDARLRDGVEWWAALVSYPVASLGLSLLFIPLHAANRPPADDPARLVTVHYLCFGLSFLVIAASLLKDVSLPRLGWRKGNWWLYGGALIMIIALIVTTNVNVARADIYFKVGDAMLGYENWDAAVSFFKRAVKLAPKQDYYRRWLGQAYLRQAMADPEHRTVWLQEAEKSLERARELNHLNSESYAHLGELYQYWGGVVGDAQGASDKLEASLSNYQRALERNPVTEGIRLRERIMNVRIELAKAYVRAERFEAAIEELEAAQELAPDEKKVELEALITELRAQAQ